MARRKRTTVHHLTEIKYSDDLTIEFERLPDAGLVRIVTYKFFTAGAAAGCKRVYDIVEYSLKNGANYMDDTFGLLIKFDMERDA